jgi:hypothetical protein
MMMKKILLSLGIILFLSFSSCGGGSSKEAKELLQKILNFVGIPQEIVLNICQDTNLDGICGATELQIELTINKGDSLDDIWEKVVLTSDGKYFLNTYDYELPIIVEFQDIEKIDYDDGKFTLNFDGFKTKEQNEQKEISILEAMVDANYLKDNKLTSIRNLTNNKNNILEKDIDSIEGLLESNTVVICSDYNNNGICDDDGLSTQEKFYSILLRDFEININTLREVGLDSKNTISNNIKEMADTLIENGVTKTLPDSLNRCGLDNNCVDNILLSLSDELIITEDEAREIGARNGIIPTATETPTPTPTPIPMIEPTPTPTPTPESDKEVIAGITFLKEEPDGYLNWYHANEWCTDKDYRLPKMSELIDVWNANGGRKSPEGFKKDTFYWAIEGEYNEHQGCAMDRDCSKEDWFNSETGNGHPKCVID